MNKFFMLLIIIVSIDINNECGQGEKEELSKSDIKLFSILAHKLTKGQVHHLKECESLAIILDKADNSLRSLPKKNLKKSSHL